MSSTLNSTRAASLAQLGADVHTVCATLAISQNELARRCRVDPAVLSKLIRAKVLAAPSETKIRRYLQRAKKGVR